MQIRHALLHEARSVVAAFEAMRALESEPTAEAMPENIDTIGHVP